MMIKCKECGMDISNMAKSCPRCGFPIEYQKKMAQHPLLDMLYIISYVFMCILCMGGLSLLAYIIHLVYLILFYIAYQKDKKDPNLDSSKTKKSLTIVTVLFVLMFGVSVFIF